MRLLKTLGLIFILAAIFQSPTIRQEASNWLNRATGNANAPVTATDQGTFDRLCPLMDSYLTVDSTGKRATAAGLRLIAKQASKTTDDPAVLAVLNTVPAALDTTNTAQNRAARALLRRECRSHGNPLTNA